MSKAAVDESTFVRERLIRGAIELIALEGCSSLGVRRLAQASERTTMCVYSKFGSRGSLLTAAYGRVAEDLLASVRTQDAAADAYHRWAAEHPELYVLLFDQPLDALDVAAIERQRLVLAVVAELTGEGEPGAEKWSRLHGSITFDRIMRQAGAAQS